ncbi:MAG: cupin domain-containing protein [Dehalococcoidia bacterium]
MPLTQNREVQSIDMMPGVSRKTMTAGDRMMLIEVTLAVGAVVPMHTHPHEQTGYLVSGRLRFQLGDDTHDLAPGDTWMIPGDLPHEVTALERSLVIDVFSPPREEYR